MILGIWFLNLESIRINKTYIYIYTMGLSCHIHVHLAVVKLGNETVYRKDTARTYHYFFLRLLRENVEFRSRQAIFGWQERRWRSLVLRLNLTREEMDGLVFDTTEEWRLDATLAAVSDIVGMMIPFMISLFRTSQGITCASCRVLIKIYKVLLNRGGRGLRRCVSI